MDITYLKLDVSIGKWVFLEMERIYTHGLCTHVYLLFIFSEKCGLIKDLR